MIALGLLMAPKLAKAQADDPLPADTGYYMTTGNPYFPAFKDQCTRYVWGRAAEVGWILNAAPSASQFLQVINNGSGQGMLPRVDAIQVSYAVDQHGTRTYHVTWVYRVYDATHWDVAQYNVPLGHGYSNGTVSRSSSTSTAISGAGFRSDTLAGFIYAPHGAWSNLPGGTNFGFTVADAGNGVAGLIQTGHDGGLYYSLMGAEEFFQGDWTKLPGSAAAAPAMVGLSGYEFVSSLGSNGHLYLGILSGAGFSGWSDSGESSKFAPCLAQVNGIIKMVHRGSGGDAALYVDGYRPGAGWIERMKLPSGTTQMRPCDANFNGDLWVAFTGLDNYLYAANLSNPLSWSPLGGTSSQPPTMAESNHRLFLAHRGYRTNHIYVWSAGLDGVWGTRPDWDLSFPGTNTQPTLFSFYGHLFVTCVDSGGTMWFSQLQ